MKLVSEGRQTRSGLIARQPQRSRTLRFSDRINPQCSELGTNFV